MLTYTDEKSSHDNDDDDNKQQPRTNKNSTVSQPT